MKTRSVVAVGSALKFVALPVSAENLPPPPFISAVAISDGQIDAAVAQLDGLAGALMKKTAIPGMAVAVVKDGKTVYAKGFSIRRVRTLGSLVGKERPSNPAPAARLSDYVGTYSSDYYGTSKSFGAEKDWR
ncbi:MAG: pbpE [Xanthobacteraceae bacterium]|nr:pbpE [Xanthobacteraceae bacterium]